VRDAAARPQLALIRAHPELAGKAMVSQDADGREHARAGQGRADRLHAEEFARIQQLNADYNAKFGWPFILAVRGPRGTGLTRQRDHRTCSRAGWHNRHPGTSSSPSACATSTASSRSG
jgi:N-carbamoyl-L-amino-acid hydrolase